MNNKSQIGRTSAKAHRELRLAVGKKNDCRSTVWKFIVHKNDAYVMTRMFGRDAKISLHETSESQWSATSEWVLKEPSRKNVDRHFKKWVSPVPEMSTAAAVFRVLVPESELRIFGETEKTKGVYWVPAPPSGITYAFDCYVTPPSITAPIPNQDPYLHLKSLRFMDSRWFVVLLTQVNIDPLELDRIRRYLLDESRNLGLEIGLNNRASIFLEKNGAAPPALIELALTF